MAIREERTSARSSIIDGFVRIFSLGQPVGGRRRRPLTAQEAREVNARAISSDWQAVGSDLRSVFAAEDRSREHLR